MTDEELFDATHKAGELFIETAEAYGALACDQQPADEILVTFNDRIQRAAEFLAGLSVPSALDFVLPDELDLAMQAWPRDRVADLLQDEIRGQVVPDGTCAAQGAYAALNRVLAVLELFARTAACRGHPDFVTYENRTLAVAGLDRPRRECLSYADQVRISYQEIDYPGSENPPGETIQMTIQPTSGVDIDRLRVLLKAGWITPLISLTSSTSTTAGALMPRSSLSCCRPA